MSRAPAIGARCASAGPAPSIELAYRTHWVSPQLSERKRERLAARQSKAPDLVVISPTRDWTCGQCGETGDLLIMRRSRSVSPAKVDRSLTDSRAMVG